MPLYVEDEDTAYDRWRDENPEVWGQSHDEQEPMHNGEWRSQKYQQLASGAMPEEVEVTWA